MISKIFLVSFLALLSARCDETVNIEVIIKNRDGSNIELDSFCIQVFPLEGGAIFIL